MKWPDELVDDTARRRTVLYIGAGVSASAASADGKRPPDWPTFLRNGSRRLKRRAPITTVRKLIDENDLLTACELLKSALDESWPELLKAEFSTPGYRPGDLHRAIHDLDLPLVLTPNFDTVFDRFAQELTSGTTVVKNYWDVDLPLVLRRNYRAILKIHGTIDEPSKMVFSRGDYADLRVNHRHFFDTIGALFLTNTFFFIGTSLNDPDLRLFLENYHRSHPQSPPHYMTSPNGEISHHVDESIRRNMNLKLIRYDPANGHQELLQGIRELGQLVTAKRTEMASKEVV